MDVALTRAPSLAGADWVGIEVLLDLVRKQLGMDSAWMSEISHGRQMFRAFAGDTSAVSADVLAGIELDSSFGALVLSGALPPVVCDTYAHPLTCELPPTRDYGIGAYVGVPWLDGRGRVGGMISAISASPNPHLGDREVRFLTLVAGMITEQLGSPAGDAARAAAAEASRVRTILDTRALSIAFQPIVSLETRSVYGFEALSRFDADIFPTPDAAFRAADRAGVGIELELMAVRRAFEQLDDVFPGIRLSVNLSAAALARPETQELLLAHAHRRLSIELTEHVPVGDYGALRAYLEPLRAAHIAVVIDDAGAGYASFQHILQLDPDAIKLDMSLTRDIDTDPARRALTRSLLHFSEQVGAVLIAEGIETAGELAVLSDLGVPYGQGFLLGRPAIL